MQYYNKPALAAQKSISSSRGVLVSDAAPTLIVGPNMRRIGLILFPDQTNPTQLWMDASTMPANAGALSINAGPITLSLFREGDPVRHAWWGQAVTANTSLTVVEIIGPDPCECQ
jgi:hypothetical protein